LPANSLSIPIKIPNAMAMTNLMSICSESSIMYIILQYIQIQINL
jgi:hypothetical protein